MRLRVLGRDDEADALRRTFERWLDSVDIEFRIGSAIELLERWQWLWQEGASSDDEDDALTYLVYWVDRDFELLLDHALCSSCTDSVQPATLSRLVRLASSELYDRSSFLPRGAVLRLVDNHLAPHTEAPDLFESLGMLLAAEKRPASKKRLEPQNEARNIQARLRDLLKARPTPEVSIAGLDVS